MVPPLLPLVPPSLLVEGFPAAMLPSQLFPLLLLLPVLAVDDGSLSLPSLSPPSPLLMMLMFFLYNFDDCC